MVWLPCALLGETEDLMPGSILAVGGSSGKAEAVDDGKDKDAFTGSPVASSENRPTKLPPVEGILRDRTGG